MEGTGTGEGRAERGDGVENEEETGHGIEGECAWFVREMSFGRLVCALPLVAKSGGERKDRTGRLAGMGGCAIIPDAARAAKVDGSRGEENTAPQSVFAREERSREERVCGGGMGAEASWREKGAEWDGVEEERDSC